MIVGAIVIPRLDFSSDRKKNKENNKTKIKNLLEKVNLIQNIVIEYNLLENLMKNSEEIIKNRGGK